METLTRADGHAERVAALARIEAHADRPRAVIADKGFDVEDFVNELRTMTVTPRVAQNTTRRSAIDGRTTRHPGYAASQHPQAHRGSVWLDQDRRRPEEGTHPVTPGRGGRTNPPTMPVGLHVHNTNSAINSNELKPEA
jgi:hypothetical protein